MKRLAVRALVAVGSLSIVLVAFQIIVGLKNPHGLWWHTYCKDVLVTADEVDRDRDGKISFREADLMCATYPLRKEIDGKLCVEELEPKSGNHMRTICRLDAVGAP